MKKITLGFLNIDYLFKILCTDDNFYQVTINGVIETADGLYLQTQGQTPSISTKIFSNVSQAEKYAAKFEIKNLKVLQIDEFNNIKTLKFIN